MKHIPVAGAEPGGITAALAMAWRGFTVNEHEYGRPGTRLRGVFDPERPWRVVYAGM